MNKAKKNIVIVGFSFVEQNSIGLPYIEKNIVHYVDSISEAIHYQGYLLIINNKNNLNLTDLDKKYRKSFHKFARIWIYNEKYRWTKDKWSGIEKVNNDIFLDTSYHLTEEWEKYKKETKTLPIYHLSKKKKLNELYTYLKSFDTISTKTIINDLNLSVRTVERYMFDLNSKYHNIGYDYGKNEWYFIW